ncbi:MAG: hypothetical protein AAF404_11440, partial [Pseudomonadota bacterium]
AFANQNGRWHLTAPYVAPVLQSRIDVLLRTNHVTTRQYKHEELNNIFTDPILLEIGSYQYQLGQLEPVSQLRYVLAGDTVYLQADEVIPLLHAGQHAFIDLAITDKVSGISINDTPLENTANWSDLQSLGLIQTQAIDIAPIAIITITDEQNRPQILNMYSIDGVAVLAASDRDYGYLLSAKQVSELELDGYLAALN